MYTALVTLQSRRDSWVEKTVEIETATERMAELTAKVRDQHPGFCVYEILEWKLQEGAVAPITTPAPKNAPKARPAVRRLQLATQRAYRATVIAFSRCKRPNELAESGYDRGVLFRLDDGVSEIWINDCVDYWNRAGICKGETVTVLNVGSAIAPIWLYSGRYSAQQAA